MSPSSLRNLSILGAFLTCVVAAGQENAAANIKAAASQPAATQPAGTQPATTQRVIEPKADELLHKMSDQLAGLPQFRMEAEVLFDQLSPAGQKIQLSDLFTVAEKRPDELRGELMGDMPGRQFWYNDHELATLDTERKVYSIVQVPGTIDAMLDYTMDHYGWTIPLSDLLLSNPYEALTGSVLTGQYVGLHRVGEFKCHHLAFVQEDLDWQIWIDAGEQALPRKLVINYKDLPGEPLFMATIVKWDTNPDLKPADFKFEPPPNATKIEMLPVEPAERE
jgi:hypothetical protein